MNPSTVRGHLRRAAEEVAAARDEAIAADTDDYLNEVERMLTYHVEGGEVVQEMRVSPAPGALDTLQGRLAETIETTSDPAAEHLQKARFQLLEAILLLDDRLNEGRETSSWR